MSSRKISMYTYCKFILTSFLLSIKSLSPTEENQPVCFKYSENPHKIKQNLVPNGGGGQALGAPHYYMHMSLDYV